MSDRQPRVYTGVCYKPNSTSYVDRSGYCSERYASDCTVVIENTREAFVASAVKQLTRPLAAEEEGYELVVLLDGLHLSSTYPKETNLIDGSDEELILGEQTMEEWTELCNSVEAEVATKVAEHRATEATAKRKREESEALKRAQAKEREELATLARLRAKHPNA